MKKVWAVEMKLLKKLLEVCEKHNLRIWAEGGTLLGTVRDKGFIPWDDDIDMAMLRDDYDKLQAIAKDEFKAPYFFQSGLTDKFHNGLTRIRMDGTTAITPKSLYHNCHQGIFIDLFPLDVIPDDPTLLKQFVNEKIKKKRYLKYSLVKHFSLTNWKFNAFLLYSKILINTKGFYKCFKEYDNFIKKYWNTGNHRVSLVSWMLDERYIREKTWYQETILLPFEDIYIPVPKDYDKILKTQFGDYMKPKKSPTNHGGFLMLDPITSYEKHLSKLRKEQKKKSINTKWNQLKKIIKNINI